jgi:hypothetical protein
MIVVEMRRAQTPEELGEIPCAMCALPFRVESVRLAAHGVADEWSYTGTICPACLDYLSTRNPSAFPTVAEFEEALRRYPSPVWGSADEVLRLEREDIDAAYAGYEASWLTRA